MVCIARYEIWLLDLPVDQENGSDPDLIENISVMENEVIMNHIDFLIGHQSFSLYTEYMKVST